ncbi:MAG: SUKH-4 family immunity protein [Riemerella sp.]|nr:SUKH-4 family immunity protein [Riemerella sp.]
MLNFTEEDIETLHQAGITAELKPVQPQQMNLIEMLKNKFALLNDYPQMNFYFIRFPDELVSMQRQGQRFQCFGKCYYGYLVLNEEGSVFLLPTNDDYTNDSVVLANDSLQEFIRCYSLLLSGVFQLKGADISTQEKLFTAFDKAAKQVAEDFYKLDPKFLKDGNLWNQFLYLIEDGWFHITYHEIFYIREGRRSL